MLGAKDLEGIVLRYGAFYGPGTFFGPGGSVVEGVCRRRFPLVGTAAGVWLFVHVDDAAQAPLAAVERGIPGVYNIAAASRSSFPRAPCCGRVRSDHDDQNSRHVERKGQGDAVVASAGVKDFLEGWMPHALSSQYSWSQEAVRPLMRSSARSDSCRVSRASMRSANAGSRKPTWPTAHDRCGKRSSTVTPFPPGRTVC